MSHEISLITPLELSPSPISIPFTGPPATFIVKVARDADSMVDAGIYPERRLIVNRALAPRTRSSNIVIAVVNGEFLVKRLLGNICLNKWCVYSVKHKIGT